MIRFQSHLLSASAVFQLYFAPMGCLRWHESSAHTFHRPNSETLTRSLQFWQVRKVDRHASRLILGQPLAHRPPGAGHCQNGNSPTLVRRVMDDETFFKLIDRPAWREAARWRAQ